MKLATIEKGSNDAHITVIIGDNEMLDLMTLGSVVPEAKGIPAEMYDLLAGGDTALAAVRKCIDKVEAMTPGEQDGLRQSNIMQAWDDVSFLPPIPNPAMVLSVGLNYYIKTKKEWGIGQVQSIINDKVTVNFENVGKKVINAKNVELIKLGK